MATTHSEETSFIKTLPAPFFVTEKYVDFVSVKQLTLWLQAHET
jgi:hypothetical protein